MRHKRVKTVNYNIKVRDEHADLRGLSFVVISDFHNNDYNVDVKAIMDAVSACDPKFVLLAGDMITARHGKDNSRGYEFVEEISSRYKTYYSLGNHEHRLRLPHYKYGDMHERHMERIEKIKESKELFYLDNASEDYIYNGVPVHITGLTIDAVYYDKNYVRTPDSVDVASTVGERKEGFNILLAHNPKYYPSYVKWGAELVFAGHYHGGIMRLPILGGVISPELKFFPDYDYGDYEKDGVHMIVSSGLGAHTLPFRFFNRVEIVKVNLI